MRLFIYITLLSFFTLKAQLPVQTTLEDFFMPGSQPLQSGDLSSPASCSCHEYEPE